MSPTDPKTNLAALYAQLRDRSGEAVLANPVAGDDAWLAQMLRDPTWQALDRRDDGALLFAKLGAKGIRKAAFLDRRSVPFADTIAGARSAQPATIRGCAPCWTDMRVIVHTGHCGSTLLARALAALPDVTVLKEPPLLRWTAPIDPNPVDSQTVSALLGRRFENRPTVVKVTSFATAAMATMHEKARTLGSNFNFAVVALGCGLDDHVVHMQATHTSDVGTGGPKALAALGADASAVAWDSLSPDGQLAADWLAKIAAMMRIVGLADRASTISSHQLLDDQLETIRRAANTLGMPCSRDAMATVMDSGVLQRAAKRRGVAMTAQDRIAQLATTKRAQAPRIHAARTEMARLCASTPVFSDAVAWAKAVRWERQ